jgi:hypothetical protein
MGRPPLRARNEQTPTANRRLKQNLNGAAIVGLIVFVFVLFYVLYWARIL